MDPGLRSGQDKRKPEGMGRILSPLQRPTMNEEAHLTDIKIWQQNTRRLLDAQFALINSLENQYDIVCIQEPYFDFHNISTATRVWHKIYPTPPPTTKIIPRV